MFISHQPFTQGLLVTSVFYTNTKKEIKLFLLKQILCHHPAPIHTCARSPTPRHPPTASPSPPTHTLFPFWNFCQPQGAFGKLPWQFQVRASNEASGVSGCQQQQSSSLWTPTQRLPGPLLPAAAGCWPASPFLLSATLGTWSCCFQETYWPDGHTVLHFLSGESLPSLCWNSH